LNIQPTIETGHYAVLCLDDEPFSLRNLDRLFRMLEDLGSDVDAPLSVWTQPERNKVMLMTGETQDEDMEGWTRRL
jgi:hypothetical protein